MQNTTQKIFAATALVLGLLTLNACEDPVPEDNYTPLLLLEAFLYVDQPVEGIRLSLTQPVLDTFRYPNSLVKDADIIIFEGETPLQLSYRETEADSGVGDYFLPDQSYLVKPETNYRIEVRTSDNQLITGETRTPSSMSWVKDSPDILQYPLDTIALDSPDSLDLRWTPVDDAPAYLIGVRCEDTLGYGQYLDPPTEEQNRRIYRFWEENAPNFEEVIRWGFAGVNSTPVVWFAFKWYGRQSITIYGPNQEFYEWFRLTHRGNTEYDFRLANVEGDGSGVFAASALVRDTVFILKNQSP